MDLPQFTWRNATLATYFFLLALWSVAGLIGVIAFTATAELCVRALEAHLQRIGTDSDHDT